MDPVSLNKNIFPFILSLNHFSFFVRMESMPTLVPRLWPFLSHSTSSVRKSTLITIKTLTQCHTEHYDHLAKKEIKTEANTSVISTVDFEKYMNIDAKKLELNFGVKVWPPQLLQDALRHIFQRVLVEHLPDIQSIAEEVWVNLVTNAELSALLHAACPYVAAWMCLAMQPSRLAFDQSLMIYAKASVMGKVRSR